jgi:rhodanese-related sulfurtransferase
MQQQTPNIYSTFLENYHTINSVRHGLRVQIIQQFNHSTIMGNIFRKSSLRSNDDVILMALQKPSRLVLDCRSKEEFECGGGFEGAVHIPVDWLERRLSQIGGDKNRYIITYCEAGARACRAASILAAAGYTHVYSTTSPDHLRQIAIRIKK